MDIKTIEPKQLDRLRREGRPVDLIDVRTPAEFREIHATGARNAPLDSLDPESLMAERNGMADRPLYVICRTGNRAEQACRKLASSGCENAVNVAGGTVAWEQAGLPVERGRKTISLERQVRIAAGLLVFLGTSLGFFVHPYFLALPAFIGAGLAYAGITDTCGMAMLLAKMPWNRVGGSCQK